MYGSPGSGGWNKRRYMNSDHIHIEEKQFKHLKYWAEYATSTPNKMSGLHTYFLPPRSADDDWWLVYVKMCQLSKGHTCPG